MSVPRDAATFGSRLREYRLAIGLTQEALAERSGVSPRTIQQLEADGARPRRSTAAYLAQALGLTGTARATFEIAAMPVPRQRVGCVTEHAGSTEGQHDGDAVLAVPVPRATDADRHHRLVALPRPTPTNVPWPVSSLIGRERDVAAIRDLVVGRRQRLLTLLGVGGAGKTRLAVQAAIDLLDAFPDGVWFVEIAPVFGEGLVPRAVAGALGVREVEDVPMLDTLLAYLRRKRLLLVLDNCEHLVDACAKLAERMLAACPDLHVITTSREPLRIDGERRWRVRPLAVPDLGPGLGGAASVDALAATPAVRLFVERAQAIDADFGLTTANAASVAQVCARLAGIPLAIELAVSHISVLGVEQIAERLDDGFRPLTGGRRAGPIRQRTMQAALDWSHDLLTDAEQATFRLSSVFAGGFELDAAEAVCSVEGRGEPDVLETLGRLVDKSLVVADPAERGRRYRLLEPVRQYAQARLYASGEDANGHTRHAAHYAALAEQAAPMLRGAEQIAWLDRLEGERDNLRAALSWIAEQGDTETGLRLAVALTPYWEARGYLSEGQQWLEQLDAASRAGGVSRAARMQAALAAARLAFWQADHTRAETLLVETLAAARDLADRASEAKALGWLAAMSWQHQAAERGLMLGEESLRLGHELADEPTIAFALLHIGITLHYLHETMRAVPILDECVRRYRRLGDTRYDAIASTSLAWVTLEAGDPERAARILGESVLRLRALGDQRFIVIALRCFVQISRVRGELHRAVQAFAASEALRASLGLHQTPHAAENDRTFRASLDRHLTAQELDDAYAAGAALNLDDLLADIAAAQ